MNIQARLEKLEQLANRRDAGNVIVSFADGTTRRMRAGDVIPLLCSPDADSIKDISDSSSARNGLLIPLLAGLIEEHKDEKENEKC